jgi:hypothetical protein
VGRVPENVQDDKCGSAQERESIRLTEFPIFRVPEYSELLIRVGIQSCCVPSRAGPIGRAACWAEFPLGSGVRDGVAEIDGVPEDDAAIAWGIETCLRFKLDLATIFVQFSRDRLTS